MCVIRVSGPYGRISSSLREAFLEFREAVGSRRARERGDKDERDESTFLCTVSDADGDRVPVQIEDAVAFLTRHRSELPQLLARDGVDRACLDFAWDLPLESPGQSNRFPRELLDLCAELGLDLAVSVYPVA